MGPDKKLRKENEATSSSSFLACLVFLLVVVCLFVSSYSVSPAVAKATKKSASASVSVVMYVLGEKDDAQSALWQLLTFVAIFVAIGLPFVPLGYTPFALAAGFLYGTLGGTVLVCLGTILGSLVGYFSCKWCLGEWVKKCMGLTSQVPRNQRTARAEKLVAFLNLLRDNGFGVVVLLRMAPIPFGLQNALFSIADIGIVVFVSATFIGLLPEILFLTYTGTTMSDISDVFQGKLHMGIVHQVTLGIQVGVMVILVVVLYYLSKKAIQTVNDQRNKQENFAL